MTQEGWDGLTDAWRGWFRSFSDGSSASQRASLKQTYQQAWSDLLTGLALKRTARQRLRVAQAQVRQAREEYSQVQSTWAAAQARVRSLEQQLAAFVEPASTQAVSAQQAQIQQLISQVQSVHRQLQQSPLPVGLNARLVSDPILPDSLNSRSE